MGMGEPLLNIEAVVQAVNIISKQLGIGGRRITISTVGIHSTLAKLAQHKLQATLAISLHAPNQALREKLVPSARVYPIEQLMRDCEEYFEVTSRRVTFEYTLMQGINSRVEHVCFCLPFGSRRSTDLLCQACDRATVWQSGLEGEACSFLEGIEQVMRDSVEYFKVSSRRVAFENTHARRQQPGGACVLRSCSSIAS
jgi:hypothetical protein